MEKVLILDSNSILHRAFHALPKLTTKKGEPTGAIYGFLLALFKAIKEIQPDYIFAAFDFPAKTFRHLEFKEYKIQRPKTPQELAIQIPLLKEILKFLLVEVLEKEGFEADDIIGTLVKKIKGKEKIILSGDYDNLQLIDKETKVWVLMKGVKEILFFGEKEVKEKYQIPPNLLADYKALVGDPSDNIPGIKGIGPKIAVQLLEKFGEIENFFEKVEREKLSKEIEKIKDEILKAKDKILLYKKLAKIKKDLEIEFELKKFDWQKINQKSLFEIFEKLEFKSLIERVKEMGKQKVLI